MNNQERIYPKTNCLALTVKQDYKLTVINRIGKTAIRVSLKALFYALFLTAINIIV